MVEKMRVVAEPLRFGGVAPPAGASVSTTANTGMRMIGREGGNGGTR